MVLADVLRQPVVHKTAVRWGEMDALQHVNNVVYFKYFESESVVVVAMGLMLCSRPHAHGLWVGPSQPVSSSFTCHVSRVMGNN